MRPIYVLEVTLSGRAQCTLPAYFGKIKRSHAEFVSLFLLLLFCLFFPLILSLLILFNCILGNTKRKHLKWKRISKLLSCFYSSRGGWQNDVSNRKWNLTSFATRASAHMNRLMDLQLFFTEQMQKHSFTARDWSLVFDPEKSHHFLYFRTWNYIKAAWFLFPALFLVIAVKHPRENLAIIMQHDNTHPRPHEMVHVDIHVCRQSGAVCSKIAKLSHIIGVRGSQDLGLRSWLWLLDLCILTTCIGINSQVSLHNSRIHRISGFSFNLASS